VPPHPSRATPLPPFPPPNPSLCSHAAVLPPSSGVVPGKDASAFRHYEAQPLDDDPVSSTHPPPSTTPAARRVHSHYEQMRRHQCMAFAERMEATWFAPARARVSMSIMEAFSLLGSYVDASDPDTSLPNFIHMLMAAEAARKACKPDWFVLTALIHDLGKVVGMLGREEDGQNGRASDGAQWAIGGDTWVLGCAMPDGAMVLPHLNDLNPDRHHPVYSTPLGVYKEGQGVMSLTYAFGHDEFLFRVLKANPQVTLPEEAFAIVRLHSCYPLHTGGTGESGPAYRALLAPGDDALLSAVVEFNSFDLYTKSDEQPDVDKVWPYYQSLIDRYIPGKLEW
jgi:inositol oxygenase